MNLQDAFSPSWRGILGRSCLLLLLVWVLPLQAKPDFTASEITVVNQPVAEGGIAQFQLVLRNRGDQPAEVTYVRIQWPLMGYLVELKGLDDVQLDHDERTITASVSLAADAERKVEMRVLAPRDSAGDALSVSMHLAHFHTMSEAWVHKTITVDTRRSPQEAGSAGWGLTSAGVVTVIWLVVTCLAVALTGLVIGGRRGFFSPRAGVVAIMVAIGFWLVFAGMAWRDYRVLNEWTASTATIIGRRVVHHTVNSQSRTTGGTSRSSDVAKPEFALRYVVQGRDMLSTGYDTGSSLRVGGGKAQLEKEFQEWTVGAQVPCWYDPRDPADVVLKRGYGGAYLFALLPLLPFALGWFILRSALSGKP